MGIRDLHNPKMHVAEYRKDQCANPVNK